MYSSKKISEILNCKAIGVNDFEITEVSVDSRSVNKPETTLFFALQGVNHNGHEYVKGLYVRGVRNFVVSEMREEYAALEAAVFFQVTNVLQALQQLATYHLEQYHTEVIGITGSNGKTVVKEWLYQLLSEEVGVYRSPRSYNSQVGVALSLLGIDAQTRLAIIEAGISLPGEMEKLQRMIRPEIGIFTHLGDAHGENFNSRQQKLEEKAILFKECHTVIGQKSEALKYILTVVQEGCERIIWGEEEDCNVRTREMRTDENGRQVEIEWQGQTFMLSIPFVDEASFENCMNAVCFLLLKGKTPAFICERVSRLQPIAMRMEIKEGINRCVLINDYYNSDAASFHLALNTLAMQDAGREKVVILSDFIDTGTDEAELYREVAMLLRKTKVSVLIGIGEVISRYRPYFLVPNCRFYKDTDSFLRQENRDHFHDQVILIKGARKFRFEYIAGFLQKQSHSTILEVDFDAMVHNLNYFRSLLPAETMIAVMVKAFSYGSGSGEVASLLQYQGVNYLMVAFADEGVELRAAGITIPIGVMNPEPEAFDNMIEFNLEPEIYSLELLEGFDRTLTKHGIEKYPVHLKLNTGMNRSGLDPEEIPALLAFFKEKRKVFIRSMFSHLAGSDEAVHDDYTQHQIDLFIQMTEEVQAHFNYRIMRHILNSAGIERFGQYAFDMVRLGIGLHGISAVGAPLLPVSSFKTYIAAIREVKGDQTVGYGRKGILKRDSRIAVVPVGYADGLDRHLSRGVGEMMVRGKRVAIVGNICMDACMVDITDTNAQVGDEIEIFGKHIPVTELSDKLETIPYEVLTSVSQRVKRVYFKE
ncbi:MAG: bifunctional UDP-N-acetylmuramoyl-tripeptide:D-alanyl-D-alanine ligase/alanine racemase [Odoribacter sp.]